MFVSDAVDAFAHQQLILPLNSGPEIKICCSAMTIADLASLTPI